MMNEQQELDRIVKKCEEIMIGCGLTLPAGITYNLNSRFTRAMGRCEYHGSYGGKPKYVIQIAKRYFDAYMESGDMTKMEDTVLHEMCHVLPNCFNHGYDWERAVNKINRKYGYNIKRCYDVDEVVKSVKMEIHPSAEVFCPKCGKRGIYKTSSVYVKYTNRYRCPCGSVLEVRWL
mgnify:FL=1